MKRFIPRLLVMELTRRCMLSCIHCRASSQMRLDNNELKTQEWFILLENISSLSRPIIILSGGEALLRDDVFEIISHARKIGFTVVLATCGIPLTEEKALRLKVSGIKRVSVSIDGKDASTHDFVRQQKESFYVAVKAIELLKKYGIEFQINTTVTQYNFKQLGDILDLAIKLGAVSFHPFFLVPVGRAKDIEGDQLSNWEYEGILRKLFELSLKSPIPCRPTCAPHYFRILATSPEYILSPMSTDISGDTVAFNLRRSMYRRKLGNNLDAITKGCLAGKSFAFISSTGKVQTCGFLEIECGDVRKDSFVNIWQNSAVFNRLRSPGEYKGKCGECEYLEVCGGCRARAYVATGDYLEEEPNCLYQPSNVKS